MTNKRFEFYSDEYFVGVLDTVTGRTFNSLGIVDLLNDLYEERNYFERKKCEYWDKFNLAHLDNINLQEENEQLKKQIQIYEQLLSNSYVGEEETLDGFVGKYVIWEDELQKYKEKIKKVIDDE